MNRNQPSLPAVLADVAQVAGLEAALQLSLALGGTKVYIPRPQRLRDGHRLRDAVGLDAARRIARHFSGETFDVPMARQALARHLAERGLAVAEIAEQLRIPVKTARRYIWPSRPSTVSDRRHGGALAARGSALGS